MAPLNVLYKKYTKQSSKQHTVGYTLFKQLRPKQCVFTGDASAANICVCMYHQNTELLVEALQRSGCFENLTQKQLLTTLTTKMVCSKATDSCHLRDCEHCDGSEMVTYVAQELDCKGVSSIDFTLWVTSPHCELIQLTEETDPFLDRLKMQLNKFVTHEFKVEKQLGFIKNAKSNLIPNKQVMVQLDFAENYTCFVQNAIQSHYFGAPTVTIHPFVIFYKTSEDADVQSFNFVVISEVKSHNTVAVYAFQKRLINAIKAKLPDVEEILYISDGCAEQYKNKNNFKNLCCHEKDFGIRAEWHFFPTSHGKGPSDGIGGIIKRMARDISLRGTVINNAEQFFKWATSEKTKLQFKKEWKFVYVTQEDYKKSEIELMTRFSGLKTITGTKSFHEVIPEDEFTLSAAEFSRSENKIIFSFMKAEKRKCNTRNPRNKKIKTKN